MQREGLEWGRGETQPYRRGLFAIYGHCQAGQFGKGLAPRAIRLADAKCSRA